MIQQHAARAAVDAATSLAHATRTQMLALGGFSLLVGLLVLAMIWRHARCQQQLLEHQAMYDNLTGLPNRRLFVDRLGQAIHAAARDGRVFALLVLDLNRFKEINDTFGHHAGDQVLRETANRVRACLRATDTVARLGGDEMAILLIGADIADIVQPMTERLLERLRQPYDIEDQAPVLGGSIGIVLYPEHGTDSETLQRRADVAMYHAKRTGAGSARYMESLESTRTPLLFTPTEPRLGVTAEPRLQ